MTVLALALILAQQPQLPRPGIADTSPFRPLELPAPTVYRTASGAPGPQYWQQKVDYDITVRLDTATHRLTGRERIRYTNNSPDTLHYLWMLLEANLGADGNRFSILAGPPDTSAPAYRPGIVITGVRAAGRSLPWHVNATVMRVDIAPLAPRGTLAFTVTWHTQVPPGGRAGRQRFPEGWLYQVAQWFPRLAVYDDVSGWNTDQFLGGGEFYLEYGDYDVSITLPASYTVGATGMLVNALEVLPPLLRRRLAAAARSDTAVAIIGPDDIGSRALLPPGSGAERTWRYRAAGVRDFAWAAAPNYRWDAARWEGALVHSLYTRSVEDVWRTSVDMTRHMLARHSRWFRYPWPTVTSASGPVIMEYPMITFDASPNEAELYYTIAHEHGHQWFPMIVGSNERRHAWMDEGLTTFIQYFAWRDRYPADTTRLRTLEFGSMRAYQQFLASYRRVETPMTETQDRSPNGLMGAWNAYGKAPVGLLWLRAEVVDSFAFDEAMRTYIRRWAFRHPQPADFFRTMNDALGEDLSWFWRGWFTRTDHLDQSVDSVAGGRLFLSNRLEMVAPVELLLSFADRTTRSIRLPVEIWMRGGQSSLPLAGPTPIRVEVDPRQVSPDVNRSNNVWPR